MNIFLLLQYTSFSLLSWNMAQCSLPPVESVGRRHNKHKLYHHCLAPPASRSWGWPDLLWSRPRHSRSPDPRPRPRCAPRSETSPPPARTSRSSAPPPTRKSPGWIERFQSVELSHFIIEYKWHSCSPYRWPGPRSRWWECWRRSSSCPGTSSSLAGSQTPGRSYRWTASSPRSPRRPRTLSWSRPWWSWSTWPGSAGHRGSCQAGRGPS